MTDAEKNAQAIDARASALKSGEKNVDTVTELLAIRSQQAKAQGNRVLADALAEDAAATARHWGAL